MTRNMGRRDRWFRALVVGPAAIVAALLIGPASLLGTVLLVVAAVMLITAAAGFCPLYALLHVTTNRRRAPQP